MYGCFMELSSDALFKVAVSLHKRLDLVIDVKSVGRFE